MQAGRIEYLLYIRISSSSPNPTGSPIAFGFSSEKKLWIYGWKENDKISDIQHKINSALPIGLEILSIIYISLQEPALQNRMISSIYKIELPLGISKSLIEQKINQILAEENLIISKRGINLLILEKE